MTMQWQQHAKRADEAHREYVVLQTQIDRIETEALARRDGNDAFAAIDLKDNKHYHNLLGNRNVALQKVLAECEMVRLHRIPEWA
jgi:hypothetical protein